MMKQANVIPFPLEQEQPKDQPNPKQSPKKKTKRRKKVEDFNITGHLIFGSIIAVFLTNTPVEVLLVLFGSLLPDIDHQKATLGKYNPINRTKFMKHRGHCHSLFGALILSAPFALIGTEAFLLVLYGCIGHLLADKIASLLPRHQKFQFKLW